MSAKTIDLQNQKTLKVTPQGEEDVLEVSGAGGAVELRIRLTPEGPVLQMESVRLELKASENVSVDCKNFEVRASESVDMHSTGGMQLTGEADIRVNATGDVVVRGEKIYLN
jgi:hypothetical protein